MSIKSDWIMLQTALDFGSRLPKAIIERYGSASAFLSAGESDWRRSGLFSLKTLKKLCEPDHKAVDKIISDCSRCGYHIITIEDEAYPEQLLNISNPPAVIYCEGDISVLSKGLCITAVGTRKSLKSSEAVAESISYRLAEAGATIISGGAKGIDISCTKGTLAANAPSAIVLGCGLGYPYLLEYFELRQKVAKNGVIISEFPPSFAGRKWTFPLRNRLMSALSDAVLLVESPLVSGANITVEAALEQGKDVFVIPGDIVSDRFAGNTKFLQDGAYPVFTAMDILSQYTDVYGNTLNVKNAAMPIAEDARFKALMLENAKPEEAPVKITPIVKSKTKKTHQVKRELPSYADDNMRKVYSCFTNEEVNTDILIEKSCLDVADVIAAITELEIEGYITSLPGERYILQ